MFKYIVENNLGLYTFSCLLIGLIIIIISLYILISESKRRPSKNNRGYETEIKKSGSFRSTSLGITALFIGAGFILLPLSWNYRFTDRRAKIQQNPQASGRVVNRKTGAPIPNVVLTVISANGQISSDTTNNKGNFSLLLDAKADTQAKVYWKAPNGEHSSVWPHFMSTPQREDVVIEIDENEKNGAVRKPLEVISNLNDLDNYFERDLKRFLDSSVAYGIFKLNFSYPGTNYLKRPHEETVEYAYGAKVIVTVSHENIQTSFLIDSAFIDRQQEDGAAQVLSDLHNEVHRIAKKHAHQVSMKIKRWLE